MYPMMLYIFSVCFFILCFLISHKNLLNFYDRLAVYRKTKRRQIIIDLLHDLEEILSCNSFLQLFCIIIILIHKDVNVEGFVFGYIVLLSKCQITFTITIFFIYSLGTKTARQLKYLYYRLQFCWLNKNIKTCSILRRMFWHIFDNKQLLNYIIANVVFSLIRKIFPLSIIYAITE